MAKLKFEGSEADLRDFLQHIGIQGRWRDEPNGVVMVSCRCGAQVHRSSTKKTIWTSGKSTPKAIIKRQILLALPSLPADASDLLD